MLKTGPLTTAGSTTKHPSVSRSRMPEDRIALRPELSMKVTSVMSSQTSPSSGSLQVRPELPCAVKVEVASELQTSRDTAEWVPLRTVGPHSERA